MALAIRNGRAYLYRSVRSGGRVRRVFVLSGELAPLLHQAETARREAAAFNRQYRAELARREREALRAADARLEAYRRAVEGAVGEALGGLGYHRAARHGWRRRTQTVSTNVIAIPGKVDAPPDTLMGQFQIRLARADPAAIVAFVAAQQVSRDGDTRRFLIEEIQGQADAFAGPNPSALVRALAECASVCWFDWTQQELAYLQADGAIAPAVREAKDRRRHAAHRRFLKSAESLARVQKLRLPVVLVNLNAGVQHQVNMGAAPEHGGGDDE